MTFDELQKANGTIKTTDINNKQYAEVNQRIKAFRMVCPNGSITTEHEFIGEGVVVFKAFVKDEEGNILGTGTAYEKEGSTFINKTSYIENCETSAVGRALAMCGFGIDLSVASYEEVANAVEQQKPKAKSKKTEEVNEYPSREIVLDIIKKRFPEGSSNLEMLLTNNNLKSIDDMDIHQVIAVYNKVGGR